jgi:hypothetical protein
MLTQTPATNFITKSQYRTQLKAAGYADREIEIKDISEHVFDGLVSFLSQRSLDMKVIGKGIGAFNVAKWIFSWWARSGVVRGCIVVARRKDS